MGKKYALCISQNSRTKNRIIFKLGFLNRITIFSITRIFKQKQKLLMT